MPGFSSGRSRATHFFAGQPCSRSRTLEFAKDSDSRTSKVDSLLEIQGGVARRRCGPSAEGQMNRRTFLRTGGSAAAFAAVRTVSETMAGYPPVSSWSEMAAAQFHGSRRFVALDQGRISCLDLGRGPAALFLHGFPLNGFQWRGVIPALASFRRCIAPDSLGLGYTEVRHGESVRPQAQAMMLSALLDRLAIDRVDVVANDSGGAIAQLFAARYPERVRTLLLTDCDTEPDSPPAAVVPVIHLGRRGRYADEWLVPWLADKTLARSESALGACYMDPHHPTDEAIDVYLEPLVASPQRKNLTNAYAASLDPNPLKGIESALKRSKAPTRIVWGTGDRIFSELGAGYLARTFPNLTGVRRVPAAKLFFPEELPNVIVEEACRLWNV